MRNFTLILFFLAPFSLFGVTKTSIANGMWSNPSIWSPTGVPTPGDDIVVNTAVTYNQNISFGMSLFHVTAGGSLVDMGTDTISFGGDFFKIEGYVSASMIDVGPVDSVVNYGTIDVADLIHGDELFVNHASGSICVSQLLTTNWTFVNNGSVSAGTWVNGRTVSGTGGKFCVSGNFVNTSQISGTIDICDASPGGFGDINQGTIAGTVTYCQVGPCSQCMLSGVVDHYDPSTVTIAPHPVQTISVFEFGITQIGEGDVNTFIVTDVAGRVVRTISFTGARLQFDRSGMESGIYFYQLVREEQIVVSGKMMLE